MLKKILKYKQYLDTGTILSIALLIVVVVGYVCLYSNGFIQRLELLNYNLKSTISAHSNKDIKPDPNIIILDISQNSFTDAERLNLGFGMWPWPRDVIAESFEFLKESGALAVVSRLSLKSRSDLKEDEALAEVIKEMPNFYTSVAPKGFQKGYLSEMSLDIYNNTYKYPRYMSEKQLDKSIKKYGFDETIRRIYRTHIKYQAKEELPERFQLDVEKRGISDNSFLIDNISFVIFSHLPDIFKDVLDHIAVSFFFVSKDFVVSSDTPVFRYVKNDAFYPSLGFSSYVSIWGENKVLLTDKYIETAGKKIPIDDQGRVKTNFRYLADGYARVDIINAILTKRYLEGKKVPDNFEESGYFIDPSYIKDKIVIVGLNLPDKDSINRVTVSTGKVLDFSTVLANQLDTYINCGGKNREQFVKSLSPFIVFIITVIFSFMTALLILKLESILNKLAVITLSVVLLITFSYGLFVIPELRYDMPTVTPLFVVMITSICTFLWQYKTVFAKRNEIEKLFGKFVSPQVKKVLVDDPSLINYEGQKKEMTILFCDLRSFTTISESYPTNQVVVQLNAYLSEMVNIIVNEYDGTLDKYIGDAIMAFWNDPVIQENHAELAVKAALAMLEKLKQLNKEWKQQGWPELKIGIGINTGEVIVGHLGGDILLDYTVIGDNVNIASRLEAMNKEYSTSLLVSKSTYDLAKDSINAKFVAERQLKGKSKKVIFYEVTSLK